MTGSATDIPVFMTLLSRGLDELIEIVFLKILENSKQFHPEHNPIIEIKVSAETADTIIIKIGDNGVSLSPDQLSRIWMPYYQADKFFTGEVEGMGLGLNLVSSIVWRVGGRCRAQNQQGGPGIIIELILPIMDMPT